MVSRLDIASQLRFFSFDLPPVSTGHEVISQHRVPANLRKPLEDPSLQKWFAAESARRLATLTPTDTREQIQFKLEQPNRFPDGSMQPIGLESMLHMGRFFSSPKELLERAREGRELLFNNPRHSYLGTVARGIPGGGASTRASVWVQNNPELAQRHGLTESLPRPLFRTGGKTLIQHTLDFSQLLARSGGKVFPNLVMTNSELVDQLADVVRSEFGGWTSQELKNTIFFNQNVLPRLRVSNGQMIDGVKYPAGHGDFPQLLGKYQMAQALSEMGIRYLVFSNADEWLWQADPVMISIAQELFGAGHHMLIIGTRNTNNQFGGAFVRRADGTQSLVETPRLPADIIKNGVAPVAINTTFYIIDMDYLAKHEKRLQRVDKSLVVKEAPSASGGVEQILGVDSWAGDVFSEILNPAFIEWPRLNFLGIKDGSSITGSTPLDSLNGRSAAQYLADSIAAFPAVMQGLLQEDDRMARFLFESAYSYLG